MTSAQSLDPARERLDADRSSRLGSSAGSSSAEVLILRDRAETQRIGVATKRDPIARPKLAELVQNRLLAVIQAENLRPGDFLPSERELMQSYAVGRPSIREAMQNLQRMGLIEINHGERPRMATPSFERMVSGMSETMRHVLVNSPTTLDHLKEVRATFEMTMAQIAARKRTAADIVVLHAILAEQERARLEFERVSTGGWPVPSSHRRNHRQPDLRKPKPGSVCLARPVPFRSGSQAGSRATDAGRASSDSRRHRAWRTGGGGSPHRGPFEPGEHPLPSSEFSPLRPSQSHESKLRAGELVY